VKANASRVALGAGVALAAVAFASSASERPATATLLADLPPDVAAAIAADPRALDGRAQLDAVFAASVPYRFEAGPLVVHTDPRWFRTATVSGPGAPLLELRRWPGDTVLALWTLARREATAAMPPVPGYHGVPIAPGASGYEAAGTVDTAVGKRPAVWIERPAGEAGIVGALILPGDAGLGDEAVASLELEARTVLARLTADPARWSSAPPLGAADTLVVPDVSGAAGTGRIASEPWQAVAGPAFTMGLPPGTRARATSQGIAPPLSVPGQLLWLRGRYLDDDGTLVAIGDGRRAGYVAQLPKQPSKSEKKDTATPPAGAPSATRSAGNPFGLAVERTGAISASAEHWVEPGFSGRWLVFRLEFEDRTIEIGLPVLAGWRSPSLYWIPISWRPSGEAPALPPVDSGERFGIEFARLTTLQRSERPWIEGYLTVPGLRADFPRGWSPHATVRAEDGFPVRIVDARGTEIGTLDRLGAAEVEALLVGADWQERERTGGKHVERTLDRSDGARLFVTNRGDGFLFELGAAGEREAWDRLVRSVRLTRPGR
jgi:hypothetical protein